MNLNVAGTGLPLLDMVHHPMLLRQVSHLGHHHDHHDHHHHHYDHHDQDHHHHHHYRNCPRGITIQPINAINVHHHDNGYDDDHVRQYDDNDHDDHDDEYDDFGDHEWSLTFRVGLKVVPRVHAHNYPDNPD